MPFKNLLSVICFITLCLFLMPVMAQNILVTGKVIDVKQGLPIPGVSVLAKGTTAGTVTDGNGAFQLSVSSSSNTLVISYIGYTQKEVAITAAPLNISLELSTTTSFGYGLQRKEDVTGAIATLTPDSFNRGAIFNPIDQLAGKIAGLTITEAGGDPNQTASISLRGQSSILGGISPLFVVDGVILDNAAQFQNIPPDDIASYDILKDASAAAIYGSRGANGVIIVTTKKGAPGRATVSYDGLVGAGVQSHYIDLLTPSEFRAATTAFANYDKGGNTDWQKAIGRTAIQQRHNVSLSGATNTFNYIASANYQNQQGIIQNTGKEQLGLRFSGDLKAIGDKLDIKAGVQNTNTTRKYTNYYNFSYMYNSPPTYPVKNADGSYFEYSDFDLANPVEHINEEHFGAKDNLTLINGSADYSITHDLKVGVLASATLNKIQSNGYIPNFPMDGNSPSSENGNENRRAYNGNFHINYDKTFGKSTLNLLAGYEYNDHTYNMDYSSGPAFATSKGSFKDEYKMRSLITRVAYNYDDLFYVTASLREDGLSTLVVDKSHSAFPSISLAYRFKKDLLANTEWISDIKLRGGYGVTGNSADQDGNPLFQWEKIQGSNVGLDFSLFKGRISGDVNYFHDVTKNLLVANSGPTPPFVTTYVLVNGGSLVNKGLEVSLSAQIISGHKLNWTVNGQITFITTKITSLSSQYTYNGQTYTLGTSQLPVGYAQGRGLSASPIEFLKSGYSPYVFYLPHYTGVDSHGNQTFDGQTIEQSGNPQGHFIDPSPKFNYGITNSFDYGNWNFNFAVRGVYGQKVFDNTLLNVETVTRLPGNNVTKEALTNGIKDAPVASDKWLEGASFLRMDNIALGYSFKKVVFASSLRVFVSANNLFVITGYRGLDPEIKTVGNTGGTIPSGQNLNGSANQAYIDNNYGGQAYYPKVRSFSLGVSIALK